MKKQFLAAGFMTIFVFIFTATVHDAAWADDQTSFQDVTKLEQISQKQDEILKKLDEIKSELQIVKVRASTP